MKRLKPPELLYIIFLFEIIIGQSIQINEIVSSNGSILFDEDGDTPDWIELHNTHEETVNLGGFSISDDPEELT